MVRRSLSVLMLVVGMLAVTAVLFAQSPALPAFKITSGKMQLKIDERMMVFTENVKFTSPMNSTLITCQRIETNAATLKQVSTVTATGNVAFNMTAEPKEKGKPTYQLSGTTQRLVYTIQGGDPVLRLEKEKGVKPSLIITDMTSKEKTDLTGTGDIIEYNLTTRTLEVKGGVDVGSEGSAQ